MNTVRKEDSIVACSVDGANANAREIQGGVATDVVWRELRHLEGHVAPLLLASALTRVAHIHHRERGQLDDRPVERRVLTHRAQLVATLLAE